jgi:hypothetical protein
MRRVIRREGGKRWKEWVSDDADPKPVVDPETPAVDDEPPQKEPTRKGAHAVRRTRTIK